VFRSKIVNILQYLLLLGLGIYLFRQSFAFVNINEVVGVLAKGNYFMAFPVLLISLLVYWFRVQRWNILFQSLHIKVEKKNQLAALALCYFVNFAVPRLGEFTRCLVLKRTDKVDINISLGTIIFERTVDTLCLAMLFIAGLILESFHEQSLINKYASFDMIPDTKILFIGIILLSGLSMAVYIVMKRNKFVREWIRQFVITIRQLLNLKNTGPFFVYTALIWLSYYLMTYLWFFTFSESSGLSMYQAFQVMIVGTFARTLPIQAGGAGAYHFAVSSVLLMMGVTLACGNALAIIIHGFQTLFTFIVGCSAYVWLLYKTRK